jgi:hypothetical protein
MSEHDFDVILAMIRWFYVRRYLNTRGISPTLLNARVHKLARSFKFDGLAEHAIYQFRSALTIILGEIHDFQGALCTILREMFRSSEQNYAMRKTTSEALAGAHNKIFNRDIATSKDVLKMVSDEIPGLGLGILNHMTKSRPKAGSIHWAASSPSEISGHEGQCNSS